MNMLFFCTTTWLTKNTRLKNAFIVRYKKKRRRIKEKEEKKQDEESYNNVFTVKTQFSLQYLQILSQSEHVWKSISMYVVRQFI